MVFTGLHLLAVIGGVAVIYLLAHLIEWRRNDRRRRSDRLVHRNLVRQTGGRS